MPDRFWGTFLSNLGEDIEKHNLGKNHTLKLLVSRKFEVLLVKKSLIAYKRVACKKVCTVVSRESVPLCKSAPLLKLEISFFYTSLNQYLQIRPLQKLKISI